MLVYREGKRTCRGQDLVRDVQSAFSRAAAAAFDRDLVISALIAAGELECALADVDSQSAAAACAVTDAAAEALIGSSNAGLGRVCEQLRGLEVPDRLTASRAEGFAYYGLHPLQFAELSRGAIAHAPAVAVIGIRSIGTTLSAVVAAVARASGKPGDRMTVRPTGHPFDREVRFNAASEIWIQTQAEESAYFLIVDEGPGLSGSSFLATAEALLHSGIDRSRIFLFGSREPDISALVAHNGAERWGTFQFAHVSGYPPLSAGAEHDISAGEWRKHFLAHSPWPAVWTQNERLKFLSRDRSMLFKFVGHGQAGEAVRQRSERLADAGWSPCSSAAGDGFDAAEIIPGRPLTADEMRSAMVLQHVARYCAWRSSEMTAPAANIDVSALEHMTRMNIAEQFGTDPCPLDLDVVRPVVADARMSAHEWIHAPDGRLWKVDAALDGDGHFFPGPCDIAWDLTAAIVELELTDEQRAYFLKEYRRISGDDTSPRIFAWVLAYCAFQLAYFTIAASAMNGSPELQRLRHARDHYRTCITPAVRLACKNGTQSCISGYQRVKKTPNLQKNQ